MGTVVLLGILSLTFLNKHNTHMRIRALMREGRIASQEEYYDGAIESYRLVISLNKKYVQAYVLLAEAAIANEDPEEAVFFLRQGLEETNDDERVRIAYNELLRAIKLEEEG
jgi:lipopolysaccharide biosynthesis regulator YciM